MLRNLLISINKVDQSKINSAVTVSECFGILFPLPTSNDIYEFIYLSCGTSSLSLLTPPRLSGGTMGTISQAFYFQLFLLFLSTSIKSYFQLIHSDLTAGKTFLNVLYSTLRAMKSAWNMK